MEKIDLAKCNNLRYRAKIDGIVTTGIVSAKDGINAFLKNEQGYKVGCLTGAGLVDSDNRPITDFEIVPRDPETYQDWQEGDIACAAHRNALYEVIFRIGELVFFKDWNNYATKPFTCSEAFRRFGYRLVLTDIEKQIIEARKWRPQDGDICFAETDSRGQRFIIIYGNNAYSLFDCYGSGWKLRENVLWEYSHIRPATDEERQKLFDAMAKVGKRWNAERKVVEDIKGAGMPFSFKRFDPVLIRMSDGCKWFPAVFSRYGEDGGDYPFYIITVIGDDGYNQCIPLNDRTEKLIDTTQKYEE